MIARAQVVQAAPVAPNKVSVLGRASAGNVAQPPAAIRGRVVVAKSDAASRAGAFRRPPAGAAGESGHPVDQATLNQLRPNTPPSRPAAAQPPVRVNAGPATVGAPGERPSLNRPATTTAERPFERPQAVEPPRVESKPAREERKAEKKSTRKAEKKRTEQ